MIRGAVGGVRTEGPPSTMAAAPSVNELHMRRVRTPATWGEARTSSTVTLRWNCASGLREAWSNALAAAAAIWRTVAPTSAMSRWAHELLSPMRMLPAGLSSSWRRSCRSWRYSAGNPSSIPAIVSERLPVHIFSTPSASTGRSWTVAAIVARCRAELPPAHELSTLMIAASFSPALRSHVCPRTQPWSLSRPAIALPTITRPSSWGDTPASSSASCATW